MFQAVIGLGILDYCTFSFYFNEAIKACLIKTNSKAYFFLRGILVYISLKFLWSSKRRRIRKKMNDKFSWKKIYATKKRSDMLASGMPLWDVTESHMVAFLCWNFPVDMLLLRWMFDTIKYSVIELISVFLISCSGNKLLIILLHIWFPYKKINEDAAWKWAIPQLALESHRS